MFVPHSPKPGFQVKSRGWTIEVKGDREVEVRDSVRGFADVGTIADDGTITYEKPEHVPKDVRAAVKILSRRLLAQDLHDRTA